MSIYTGHMVTDPAAQHLAITRILAANLGDKPSQAVHDLGFLLLTDGTKVKLYARHAADPIITDDFGQIVLITRSDDPGVGKLALPGGFVDNVGGIAEAPIAAAIREAHEETSIATELLKAGRPVGRRRYDRPFDIRCAYNDPPGTKITKGEWFGVSTQGFHFHIPGDLKSLHIAAGDDAKAAGIYLISKLKAADFAVPDHLEMIRVAVGGTI